mgnify:FL=1
MARLVYADPAIRIRQPKSLIVYLPEEMRPFEYTVPRPAKGEVKYFPSSPKPEELLTGYVHGKRASDLEERFALALQSFGIDFIFQFEVPSAYSLPDEAKLIDFLVFDGGLGIPIEIGASFFHASPSQKEEERERQNTINPILQLQGIWPLGDPRYQIPFDEPVSIEQAKDIVSQMFLSA